MKTKSRLSAETLEMFAADFEFVAEELSGNSLASKIQHGLCIFSFQKQEQYLACRCISVTPDSSHLRGVNSIGPGDKPIARGPCIVEVLALLYVTYVTR